MRSGNNGSWRWAQAATWSLLPIILSCSVVACDAADAPAASVPSTARVAPQPPAETPLEPVSESCRRAVKEAESKGLIKPGTVDRDGAVILTDARWATRLDADLQQQLALCVSHYLAGGQNRWIKRVQFRNQATGVTYATVEGDRFRIGE